MMNSLVNLLLHHLMLLFVLTLLVPQGHAHAHLISLGKEKVTHLHFFYQERLTGDNLTAMLVGKPKGTTVNATNLIPFGAAYVLDAPLTEGQDPNSKVVGKAQGLAVSADQDTTMVVFMLDFGLSSGKFKGSSFSVLSRNPLLETDRELSIVGGRGKFRMARGFANLHTNFMNLTSGFFTVEYNVVIFHYDNSEGELDLSGALIIT